MESYKCIVYDDNNKRRILKLDFNSEKEVLKYAKENNLRVSSIERKNSFFNKKLKDKELKVLCKQIEILFKSGCEITKLLEILKLDSSKKIRDILDKVSKQIEQGSTITEAFNSTRCFSAFFINNLYAGEISSNLDGVMEKLSDYYEKEEKIKSKVLSISIYPVFLFAFIFFIMTYMIFKIIPDFESIYVQSNIELTGLTAVIVNLSRFIRMNYLTLFISAIAIISTFIYILKTNQEIRLDIYKKILKLPFVGNYCFVKMTSKFSKALCILMKSGLDVVKSIDIAAKVIDKEYIYNMISMANEDIENGNGIGISLSKINLFPKLFTSFITIGENTGELDTVLEIVTSFYEKELETKIDIMFKILKNGMMLIMGVIVGGVVMCMLLPMFSLVSSF